MTEPIHAHDPIDQLVADGRAVPARRTAAERPKPLVLDEKSTLSHVLDELRADVV
jgi:hypothetical protein